ncbi:MAG: hypothetical protein HZB53_06660 [Chloroflexi bacterium]|nr:hypothetical protein [Chloroflexota bacterium]
MQHIKPSRAHLEQLRKCYAKARKPERSKLVDEFVKTSHYERKYALALLKRKRNWRAADQPIRRRRAIYTDADKRAVAWLAAVFDRIGSKRLRVAMDSELANLRRLKHLAVSSDCYAHLQVISASTMDRMRRAERRPVGRTRGGTKPGLLLKTQITIRTFAQWDDKRPGFEEIDLIQHDGGNTSGFFACMLTVTDISSGWTELRAVSTKAQSRVFAALKHIRAALPFVLLGIDSNHGAEFINAQLYRYCVQEQVAFTRVGLGARMTTRTSSKRIGPSHVG